MPEKNPARSPLVPFLGVLALLLFGLNFYVYLERHLLPWHSYPACLLVPPPGEVVMKAWPPHRDTDVLERRRPGPEQERARRALEEALRQLEAEIRFFDML